MISGNAVGIVIAALPGDSVSTGNLVQGNFIGTDVTGKQPLPNSNDGIFINGDSNTVGGTTPATRNIISGNIDDGIALVQTGSRLGASGPRACDEPDPGQLHRHRL